MGVLLICVVKNILHQIIGYDLWNTDDNTYRRNVEMIDIVGIKDQIENAVYTGGKHPHLEWNKKGIDSAESNEQQVWNSRNNQEHFYPKPMERIWHRGIQKIDLNSITVNELSRIIEGLIKHCKNLDSVNRTLEKHGIECHPFSNRRNLIEVSNNKGFIWITERIKGGKMNRRTLDIEVHELIKDKQ